MKGSIASAIGRAEEHLFEAPVIEALLARRLANHALEDDEEAAAEVAQELISHQSEDGSWGGQLTSTAEALLLLGDLVPHARSHPAAARATQWLQERQDRPGRFGERCEPELHDAQLCHHAVSGFFSPAAPHISLAGLVLANGVVFKDDWDARIGASATALRAWLRWRAPTDPIKRHIQGLVRLAERSFRPDQALVDDAAALEVLSALAAAPRSPDVMAALHSALSRVVSTQRSDGTFGNVDAFRLLEVLHQSIEAGYSSPLFDAAIQRSAELLTHSQQEDGSWGYDVNPRRTLIAWRTLRFAHALQGRP